MKVHYPDSPTWPRSHCGTGERVSDVLAEVTCLSCRRYAEKVYRAEADGRTVRSLDDDRWKASRDKAADRQAARDAVVAAHPEEYEAELALRRLARL